MTTLGHHAVSRALDHMRTLWPGRVLLLSCDYLADLLGLFIKLFVWLKRDVSELCSAV